MKLINVLVLENEKLLIGVLNKAFTSLNNNSRYFQLKPAIDCSQALKELKNKETINIALLNNNIPPCNVDGLVYVEDINAKLRLKYPNIKIILFSSYRNNIQIQSILKTINPDFLLVKSDIDYTELVKAIETVLFESPYYSRTVLKYIRKRLAHNIVIDKIDKSILYYLSLGIKMKDIPSLIHLSISAIEFRKRKLKDVFGLDRGTDNELLDKARDTGFI